jgi:16S rRNA C967 or C1407 C5-methylase (RsmB/RsmF family)
MLQGLHKSSKVPEGEMDRGKEKRKRGDKESEQGRKKKVRGREGKEEVVTVVTVATEEEVVTVATEEEVEEFFAILRRMQEAAKYFGKGSGEGWRAAVEAKVVEVIDGGGNNEEEIMIQSSGAEEVAAVVEEEEENGVLDLNATPVVESDGA